VSGLGASPLPLVLGGVTLASSDSIYASADGQASVSVTITTPALPTPFSVSISGSSVAQPGVISPERQPWIPAVPTETPGMVWKSLTDPRIVTRTAAGAATVTVLMQGVPTLVESNTIAGSSTVDVSMSAVLILEPDPISGSSTVEAYFLRPGFIEAAITGTSAVNWIVPTEIAPTASGASTVTVSMSYQPPDPLPDYPYPAMDPAYISASLGPPPATQEEGGSVLASRIGMNWTDWKAVQIPISISFRVMDAVGYWAGDVLNVYAVEARYGGNFYTDSPLTGTRIWHQAFEFNGTGMVVVGGPVLVYTLIESGSGYAGHLRADSPRVTVLDDGNVALILRCTRYYSQGAVSNFIQLGDQAIILDPTDQSVVRPPVQVDGALKPLGDLAVIGNSIYGLVTDVGENIPPDAGNFVERTYFYKLGDSSGFIDHAPLWTDSPFPWNLNGTWGGPYMHLIETESLDDSIPGNLHTDNGRRDVYYVGNRYQATPSLWRFRLDESGALVQVLDVPLVNNDNAYGQDLFGIDFGGPIRTVDDYFEPPSTYLYPIMVSYLGGIRTTILDSSAAVDPWSYWQHGSLGLFGQYWRNNKVEAAFTSNDLELLSKPANESQFVEGWAQGTEDGRMALIQDDETASNLLVVTALVPVEQPNVDGDPSEPIRAFRGSGVD